MYQQESEFSGAVTAFAECRDVRLAILAVDPGNLQRQRDLGVCQYRLGQSLEGSGDLAGAVAEQDKALITRRALALADPTDKMFQLDLSFSLLARGRLSSQLNSGPEALALFGEAITVLEALALADPSDLLTQRDLTIYASEAASMALMLGDAVQADGFAALALRKADILLAAVPEEDLYLGDQMVAANRLGDARALAEDAAGALAAYQIMVDGAYAAAAANPSDTQAAWTYSLALMRRAEVRISLGEYAVARADLEVAVGLREWLVGLDPAAVPAQVDLAFVLQKLADTHFFEKSLPAGAPFEERALGIFRRVDQAQPGQVWNILNLVTALDRAASYQADPKGYYRESLALLEAMQARGEMPDDYLSWIENYRKALAAN